MTSPNRETEAQQVKAAVEPDRLARVKAGLRIKRGKIERNLELVLTGIINLSDRDQKVTSKADRQETEKVNLSDQDQKVTSKADRQEMVTANLSDQDQKVISKADHQEMVTANLSDPAQ